MSRSRSLSAWDSHADLIAAGYVVSPASRYVDREHGIDWAVIVWQCPRCGRQRHAPGPGDPPLCYSVHGPMVPFRTKWENT